MAHPAAHHIQYGCLQVSDNFIKITRISKQRKPHLLEKATVPTVFTVWGPRELPKVEAFKIPLCASLYSLKPLTRTLYIVHNICVLIFSSLTL